MIDKNAEPARGCRRESGDDRGQVVDAPQVLHHDADIAQVVAPDLLHELGIVAALDVDPARPRHLGPARRGGDRPRGRSRGSPGGPAPRVPTPSGPTPCRLTPGVPTPSRLTPCRPR